MLNFIILYVFISALKVIPKLGRRKVMINGKPCGRNELIADYIRRKTLKIRTRKQVSSHIQVLKNLKRNDQECEASSCIHLCIMRVLKADCTLFRTVMNLVTENMDDIEGFPAALLQAGFHMAQLPCLKTDIIVPHFTLGGGLPTLGHLSASPMSLHQAMNGNPLLGNTLPGPPLSGSSDVSFENMQASMPYPNYYFGSFQQPPHQQQQLQSQQQSLSQFPQQDEGSSTNVFQNGHHGMLGPALYDNESHTASV